MKELKCTYDDYKKAAGFTGLKELSEAQPGFNEFFQITKGGMHLPTVTRAIQSNPALDSFIADELNKFSSPNARLFGENTFTVVGSIGKYRVGHLERYCGPTLRMNVGIFRNKSGGKIEALAHTHPYFRGVDARVMNRDGSEFGPGDWVSLVAFQCPVYLYTPYRKIYVMEYDSHFVTVRPLRGAAEKWHVSLK